MSKTVGIKSNEQIPDEIDRIQNSTPHQSNKEDDTLEGWIDNFLVETGDLEEDVNGGPTIEKSGESSEKQFASAEDVSAWADIVLSRESSDEEKGDESQCHSKNSESDDVGSTRDARSANTPSVIRNDDDDNDQAEENDFASGSFGIVQPSPDDQNLRSWILASASSDSDDELEAEERESEPPYFPFNDEEEYLGAGSGREDASAGESSSKGNKKYDPNNFPSHSFKEKTKSRILSRGDSFEQAIDSEDEIQESTPILPFDIEDGSLNERIASGESNGGKDRENPEHEKGPTSLLPPQIPKKRSSTSITTIHDEQAGERETQGEIPDPTQVEPGVNENESIGLGTDDEYGNNRDPQPDHGLATNTSPRYKRKRSSTSITMDSEEQDPMRESVDPKLVQIPDNADDVSGMGITSNTSDWDEIDLNSENEDVNSTSTGEVAPQDNGIGVSTHGGTDPILPENSKRTYASYFKMYFNFLYHLGLTPYNGDGKNACGILNIVLFALVAIVAALHTAVSIKEIIISDTEEKILLRLIRVGYDINIFLFRLYHVYLITFKVSSIAGVIKAAEAFGAHISRLEIFLSVGSTLLLSLVLGLTSPLVLIIASIPGKWDFEDVALASSEDFATMWVIWSNDESNRNYTQYIWDTYGTDVTNTVVMMSVAYFAFGVIGFVQLFVIKDYSIVASLTMYKMCSTFSHELESMDRSAITQENCQQLWERYKLLRAFSGRLNDSHGFLFQLFHLDNSLFSAYLLLLQFVSGGSLLVGILQFCIFAKVVMFYLFAANAAVVNDKLDSWAQSTFPGANTLIIENGEILTTSNLLHQLDKNPIGIGRGMFFINGAFLWKFISVVGSFFIFFTENRQ